MWEDLIYEFIDMRQTIELNVASSLDNVFTALRDLETYTEWLSFIDSIEKVEIQGEDQSWIVVLRSQLGPFARMKKLRMVKSSEHLGRSVCFSRSEVDAKEHSSWDLEVSCSSLDDANTKVALTVSYGGKFWSRPLETAFNSHVEEAKTRLRLYFESRE